MARSPILLWVRVQWPRRRHWVRDGAPILEERGAATAFGARDTSRCLAGTAKWARNQPLWEMLIPDGPCFVHIPGIFLLESRTLGHNAALLGSPFAGGYLRFLVKNSRIGCGSSHHPSVPAEFPADRISHFCSWFVQSGRVRLLSKNISCGWLTEEEWEGLLTHRTSLGALHGGVACRRPPTSI